MELREQEMELDLREYIYMIKKRLWFIILITILAITSSGMVSFFVLDPIYQATTTVMVGKPVSYAEGSQLQIQDLNLNQRLARTYGEIVQSRVVSEEVIFQLGLDITPGQLKEKTSVNLVKDTEFITISVTDTNPEKAANIANNLAEVFKKQVMDMMRVDNVQVLDDAVVPTSPIKPNKIMNMAIAGVLGMMVSLFIVFLLEYMDNTIKSPEDISRHLGLNVIGTIPMMEDEQ
ncbi:YveK family protein [Alkaliphilus sp. B6464]|uniref:YveK family protein n=1 Tax=Alkaliphilus sp. B6464 TaxID=2731219 RepID=UPI001BA952E4|nr:Wzz/FepE/Etk N-terminal domain-containing protein [Alkaliphilus sp. B6464]QUH19077.1 chain-length determining protein [Alkaliphilus sp. B6464]